MICVKLLHLLVILLQLGIIGEFGVDAVWKCKTHTGGPGHSGPESTTPKSGPVGPKASRRNQGGAGGGFEVYDGPPTTLSPEELEKLHPIARQTVYWCDPSTTVKYLGTQRNPTANPKTVKLAAAPYGVINISSTNHHLKDPADVEDLRRELRHEYEWNEADVKELREAKEEVREVKLGPNRGAIYFHSIASCFNQLDPEFPEFNVATEPFDFELPDLGKCTPRDQYVPIRNDTYEPPYHVDTAGARVEDEKDPNQVYKFENSEDTPLPIKLVLKNYGFMWKLKLVQHLKRRELQKLFVGSEAVVPANDPLIASLRTDIVRIFSGIKSSPTTGITWKKEFFGAEFPLVSREYSQEIDKTLPAKSVTRFFQLVGECGDYKVYTNQIYARVYDEQGKCVEQDAAGGSPEGISRCNFCTTLECAKEEEFLDKIEYRI